MGSTEVPPTITHPRIRAAPDRGRSAAQRMARGESVRGGEGARVAARGRRIGGRLAAVATAGALGLSAAACSGTLSRDDALSTVRESCNGIEIDVRDDPGSADDGLTVVLDLSVPRNDIRDADVTAEVAQELDPLEAALSRLTSSLGALSSRLSTEDHQGFEDDVAAARDAHRALLEATDELGLPECAPPAITEQIDGVEERLAGQAAATAPSGDYVVDLQAACDRFAEDLFGDLADPGPAPVRSISRASNLGSAYERLLRDVQRLDPGERAEDHARLVELLEEASDLANDLVGALDDQDELDDVRDRLIEVSAEAGQVASADCAL